MSTLEPLAALVERHRHTRERAAINIALAATCGQPTPVHDLATFLDADRAYHTTLNELKDSINHILTTETTPPGASPNGLPDPYPTSQ